MNESERLARYYEDCLWVGRAMSPLRNLRVPSKGCKLKTKDGQAVWVLEGKECKLTLEEEIILPHLTTEKAAQVRNWRCGIESCSWRKVADLAYEKWDHPDWMVESHQAYGEALCRLSAALLGEDPNSWDLN